MLRASNGFSFLLEGRDLREDMREEQRTFPHEAMPETERKWNPGEKNKKERFILQDSWISVKRLMNVIMEVIDLLKLALSAWWLWVIESKLFSLPEWIELGRTQPCQRYWTLIYSLLNIPTLRFLAPIANIPTAVLLSSSYSLSQSLSVSVLRICMLTTLVTAQEDVKD